MDNLNTTENLNTQPLIHLEELILIDSDYCPLKWLLTKSTLMAVEINITKPTLIIPTIIMGFFPELPSSSASRTPSKSQNNTPIATPTYAILPGKIIPEHANCHYGHWAPYLYLYGLVAGSNLETTSRDPLGSWILIHAIGGNNPRWFKAELMEILGDFGIVQPYAPDIFQEWSPYLPFLTRVTAVRNGEKVSISWHPL